MRCEGADNPPCRRCKNTGLECLFEKPSREATLTGEAGLEYAASQTFQKLFLMKSNQADEESRGPRCRHQEPSASHG